MSLTGALNVGRTAMAVTQAALQVTGNNIANAGNADYTRQIATMAPALDQKIQPGMFIGTGVDLTGMVAASEDDWDRYKSLQWRAAVETGGDEVMETHLGRRNYYLSARRAELGWAIFTGRAR